MTFENRRGAFEQRLATRALRDFEMPPLNRRQKYPGLSSEEIDQVRAWINAGAPWPAAAGDGTDPHEIAGAEPLVRN